MEIINYMTARHPKYQVQVDGLGSAHDSGYLFVEKPPFRFTHCHLLLFTIACAWFIIMSKKLSKLIERHKENEYEVYR
jgi:hypothetical protein